jgi:hypothetical protein
MQFPSTAGFLKGKEGKEMWRNQKKQDMKASQKDGKRGRSRLRYTCPTHGAALNTHGARKVAMAEFYHFLRKSI